VVVLFVEDILLVVIGILFMAGLLLNRLLGCSGYYIMRGLSQLSVQLVKIILIDFADVIILIILKVFTMLLLLLDSVSQVIFPEGITLTALLHLPVLLSSAPDGSDFISFGALCTRYDLRVLVEDA
jgi:hypothetical protein